MRSYIFTICCLIIYSIIIGLDFFNDWPSTERDDILMLISIITIFFTSNYILITKYLPFNIYNNYKNLIIAPVVPRQCFIKELFNYIKTFQNLLFFMISYLFFIYFIGFGSIEKLLIDSFSFISYYIFFLYSLIVLRFFCGHSPKGRSTFLTICLLINSLVMYQVIMVNKENADLFRMFIVEYNPLNTIFFICVTKGESILFLIMLYLIFSIIQYLFTKRLTWEKHLEFS
jgi:hypothetical protein